MSVPHEEIFSLYDIQRIRFILQSHYQFAHSNFTRLDTCPHAVFTILKLDYLKKWKYDSTDQEICRRSSTAE